VSDTVVRRDVPGLLVIERRLWTVQRGLLAAVLLGGALYVASYLVRAWRYFSAVATAEEWRQAYPGFALTALAVAVPAAIAWVLVLRRRSVELDLTERRLTSVRDDRIYTRRQRYAFADVTRVTVTRRHRKNGPVTFPVTIVLLNGSRMVISDAPGKAQARATATLVADIVGVQIEQQG
jgi:hypothetical protein